MVNYLQTWPLIAVLLILSHAALANAESVSTEFKAKIANGTELTKSELSDLVRKHKRWLKTGGKRGKRLNLDGAQIKGANLDGTELRKAKMNKIKIESSSLNDVNFYSADLTGATIKNSSLVKARLSQAQLNKISFIKCNLRKAIFFEAVAPEAKIIFSDLTGSNIGHTNLSKSVFINSKIDKSTVYVSNFCESLFVGTTANYVEFIGVNLKDARFSDANFYRASLNLLPGKIPTVSMIYSCKSLYSLTYTVSPHSLYELRNTAKHAGLKFHEKELTYAIMHNERLKTYGPLWGGVTYLAFEFPSGWGRYPGRPLLIMLLLIPVFFIPYLLALLVEKKDGLWQTWPEDRNRSDLGSIEPQLLHFKWNQFRAYAYAFYFSVLSAFHIGWRDLNVGTWITRMQPREYTLRATGWVRTVSGIQSLISVYLLALAILTYFGRPFG